MSKKKLRLVTATGYTVDDILKEYRAETRKRVVDQEVVDHGKAIFDKATARSRDFYMLGCVPDLSEADRTFIDTLRSEHLRLATGLAKLLWKVK